ncbi:MAG: hypothetical protein IJ207_00755 [Treponema sp.]|uniref:type I restriction endonuclease n=1 Tax=Treponema sp. TaxID=166 RepID=UPI0025D30BF1|nr:type I restriction endonuclease [Treponema sp.]MBQ9280716.1 hypothetical protein [Treponema sp.]
MSDYNEEAYENALIERSRIWDGSMFMGRKLTATFYDSVLEDSIRRLNPKAAPDDKNSYIVANQWTFIENSNKRPDILLFLNGLSVCLFELKSPSLEQTDASEADSMGVPVCCSRRSGYSRVCLQTRYKNGNAILAGSAIAPLPKGNGFAAATIPNAF